MAEPTFLHWFKQYTPSQWEPWLEALPDYGYTTHWTKLQWCNWYFRCRIRQEYLDNLVLEGVANIAIDGERVKRGRRDLFHRLYYY